VLKNYYVIVAYTYIVAVQNNNNNKINHPQPPDGRQGDHTPSLQQLQHDGVRIL